MNNTFECTSPPVLVKMALVKLRRQWTFSSIAKYMATHCDITFICRGRKIVSANRAFLCGQSKILADLLCVDHVQGQGHMYFVTLADVEARHLESVLELLTTGETVLNRDVMDIIRLLGIEMDLPNLDSLYDDDYSKEISIDKVTGSSNDDIMDGQTDDSNITVTDVECPEMSTPFAIIDSASTIENDIGSQDHVDFVEDKLSSEEDNILPTPSPSHCDNNDSDTLEMLEDMFAKESDQDSENGQSGYNTNTKRKRKPRSFRANEFPYHDPTHEYQLLDILSEEEFDLDSDDDISETWKPRAKRKPRH